MINRFPSSSDVIFALATHPARSALHVHRISGQDVITLLSPHVFNGRTKKKLDLISLFQTGLSHSAPIVRYITLHNTQGQSIDDMVLTLFFAPQSFTGEHTIELSTHGNPLIDAKLHSFLRSIGIREAQPGEFTYRAVRNGKIDLAQAEGINQLIHAETVGALSLAQQVLEGSLTTETKILKSLLLSTLSYLEAHIDFSPEEVGSYTPQTLSESLERVQERLKILLGSYAKGVKAQEGLKVILTGLPNAGKSSLYNALLRSERAIVTHIPGTTRDILTEHLILQERDFILLDTAGIRSTEDVVESIGVTKALESIKKSDIVCLVIDGKDLMTHKTENIQQTVENAFSILEKALPLASQQVILRILSKADLLSVEARNAFAKLPVIMTSYTDIHMLDAALIKIHDALTGGVLKSEKEAVPILISERQKDKVALALKSVADALDLVGKQDYPEKIASVIQTATFALQEIIGEINLDNILDHVFSKFCIGK